MKHDDIISKMTLEEKAAILSGKNEWESLDIPRLDIKSIFCSDGPHGLRKQEGAGDHLGLNESVPATCFPTAATVSNSWDIDLAEEIGEALGVEAVNLGVDILLGPGLNIKRSALCGRNFEYFSEDPYLSGKMAAGYIKGIQSRGICACPKHFAVNSQELRRMAMNSVLDERTLREIYLTGFEIAIKEGGAKCIMSSYNEINGIYANENEHLLQDILRDEWEFDGIVITDWGGSNDHVKGVKAGSNLEMPNPGLASARELVEAIRLNELDEGILDKRVDEFLNIVHYTQNKIRSNFDKEKHHKLAKKAASESAVLLKNENDILPLKPKTKVAIIGDFAITPRYQGAGSSMVNSTKVECIKDVIKDYDLEVLGIEQGYKRDGITDDVLTKKARDLARKAEIVLYFFGLDEISESEGLDREHTRIPQNQINLLHEISQVNHKIIGVISAGAAIEMPWQNMLAGILHTYLSGQASAGACMDILVGNINPSGKLNESYPINYEDSPASKYYPAVKRNSEYRESIFVGYRYYDYNTEKVLYPFGYGLSYTSFEYSNLSVSKDGVKFTVKNTGAVAGAEAAQLYIGLKGSKIFRAKKELKGFKKVYLEPGESRDLEILFDDKSFRFFNMATNSWQIETGSYDIYVAASSNDIRLTAVLDVTGDASEFFYSKDEMPNYYNAAVDMITDDEFEGVLGHKIPSNHWSGKLNANDALCQMYYAKSFIARFLYNKLTKMKRKSEEKGIPDLNILFIYNMPFRAIAKMSAGNVDMHMVDGIVEIVNGSFFKGIVKVIGGYFRNRSLNKAYAKLLKKKE